LDSSTGELDFEIVIDRMNYIPQHNEGPDGQKAMQLEKNLTILEHLLQELFYTKKIKP